MRILLASWIDSSKKNGFRDYRVYFSSTTEISGLSGRGEDNGHLGLQFLGNGEIQYVMFIQRPNASEVSRGAGRDNFEGIDRQILAYVLDDLLYQ